MSGLGKSLIFLFWIRVEKICRIGYSIYQYKKVFFVLKLPSYFGFLMVIRLYEKNVVPLHTKSKKQDYDKSRTTNTYC